MDKATHDTAGWATDTDSEELLYVNLTPAELTERGQQLAATSQLHDSVEEEAKEIASSYRTQIKGHRNKMKALSKVIEEKREERMVPVVDRPDYGTNLMVTIRVDTGEIIRSRTLTPEELQGQLFGEA